VWISWSFQICKKLVVRSRRQNERLVTLTGKYSENSAILEQITDKDGNYRFEVTDNQARQGMNVGKFMHLNCFIVTSTLLSWEKLNTYKQHSGAVTVKCSSAKKIKVIQQSVGSKAVWVNISTLHVKLWDAMDPTTNIPIFPKESKCSLLPTANWQGIETYKELGKQKFSY
jgi:hypothetical protein